MNWFGHKPQQPQPPTNGPNHAELDAFGNHSPYNRAFQGGEKIRRTVVRTEVEEHSPQPPAVSEEALFYKWEKMRKRRGVFRDFGIFLGTVIGTGILTEVADHTVFAPKATPNYPHVPAPELSAAHDAAATLEAMQTAVVKPLFTGLNGVSLTDASDAIGQMLILLPDGAKPEIITAIQAAGKALKDVNDALLAANQLLPQLAQADATPLQHLLDTLPH